MKDKNSRTGDYLLPELNRGNIEEAFTQDYFKVFYQPVVTLANPTKVNSAEAFVRLMHPSFGMMLPSSFFPLLKKLNLEEKLTELLLGKILNDWNSWNEKGIATNISINIDTLLVNDSGIAEKLIELASQYQVPQQRITLEISKINEQEISSSLIKKLNDLRLHGFRLALDDFGREPIPLSELAKLPLNEIKIHRQVILGITNYTQQRTRVRQALQAADQLGLGVTAVGVENESEATWLRKQGCDSAQGFLFGKPKPASDFYQQVLVVPYSDKFPQRIERFRLLVIEGDEKYRKLLVDSLSESYQVNVAINFDEAKSVFQQHKPQVIIADLEMPEGSGIELCNQLLQLADSNVAVVYTSTKDDLEQKMKVYESGGIEFIVKPFRLTELLAKLNCVVNNLVRQENLVDNVNEIQSAALQSMQEASHYGDVVQFFKNLLYCHDEQMLADALFQFMQQKSLICSVQFRNPASINSFDQKKTICSPIEINVFEILISKGRLYEFGDRVIVNDKHVSFLVKNMPVDEGERGRVRDYVAVLSEGLEARYLDILRQRALSGVLQKLDELAGRLSNIVQQHEQDKSQILERFTLELRLSFHILEMTEEQENYITEMIHRTLEESDNSDDYADAINSSLVEITKMVSTTLESMHPPKKESIGNREDEKVELF